MRESTQYRTMDDYFHALLLEESLPEPELQPLPQPAAEPLLAARPYLEEPSRIERLSDLLAQVGQVQDEMEVIAHQEVEAFNIDVATAIAVAETQAVVEPTVVEPEVVPASVVEQEVAAPAQTSLVESAAAPTEWRNIEPGHEFQALFFEVAGVMFAVPLTELGGIHRLGEVTSLFGQAPWFQGIMTQREKKLSVVDTAQWVMPDEDHSALAPYQYLIMLGDSSWGLSCHHLKGTEKLRSDQIKWRHQEGKRPWLAGMVKDKRCALLHVHELLRLLDRGVNIDGR